VPIIRSKIIEWNDYIEHVPTKQLACHIKFPLKKGLNRYQPFKPGLLRGSLLMLNHFF